MFQIKQAIFRETTILLPYEISFEGSSISPSISLQIFKESEIDLFYERSNFLTKGDLQANRKQISKGISEYDSSNSELPKREQVEIVHKISAMFVPQKFYKKYKTEGEGLSELDYLLACTLVSSSQLQFQMNQSKIPSDFSTKKIEKKIKNFKGKNCCLNGLFSNKMTSDVTYKLYPHIRPRGN